MQHTRIGLLVALSMAIGAADGLAQRGGNQQQWQRRGESTVAAVAQVATNAAIAAELALTPEQIAVFAKGLDADKVKSATAAWRLAEMVTTALSDPEVAQDLGLTEEQRASVRGKMTPELIRKTFTAEEIDAILLSANPAAAARAEAMREQMRQFDRDGDGQISPEEREAAKAVMRQRYEERQRERPEGENTRRGGDLAGGDRAEKMKRFDTDGDGVISAEEKEAARATRQRE